MLFTPPLVRPAAKSYARLGKGHNHEIANTLCNLTVMSLDIKNDALLEGGLSIRGRSNIRSRL